MRDRLFVRFVVILLTLRIVNSNAYCFCIDSWISVNHLALTEDLIVTDAGKLDSNLTEIEVLRSVSILNSGIINSDFDISDSYQVYVKNSGTINGTFHVAPNAKLVQVIHSDKDITDLSVDRNFAVLVQNAMDVSLTDVFSIAANADKLILDNSTLFLHNPGPRNTANTDTPAIQIVGDVIIKLNSVHFVGYVVPMFRNVSDTGHVRFEVLDMNPLYNALAYVSDGDLYMKIIRETDYVRIFQNDVGKFLNDLRRDIPNDKLLTAMDNAPDMDTINSIMRDSVRLHPAKLMTPVRRMHMLDALGGWWYSDTSDIDGTADVMFSGTSLLERTNISWVGNVSNNLRAAVGGYIGALAVTDDINDYSGGLCGANMRLHFDDGTIIANLTGGIGVVYFDVGPVFDGAATVNNPSGISGVVAMDVGTYLYRKSDLTIVPFAGVLTNYVSVLNDNDMGALANVGLELNLSEHDFDILYDYGLRTSILTDGAYHVGVFAKFLSPDDDIGARVSAELVHDEIGFGYKISVSMNMSF